MHRAARSATVGSGSGSGGTGSRPRLMRSMMVAALRRLLSIATPAQGPSVTRWRPAGPPGLDDVDLAAVALDADAEAGEVSVPVDGVLAGGRKGRDAAGGEAEGASLRHGDPPTRSPDPS